MRLITRLTDTLVERLAPKAVGRAGCSTYYTCSGPCTAAGQRCCYRTSDCVTGCEWRGC